MAKVDTPKAKRPKSNAPPAQEIDLQKLVEDLKTHQIELEMQNDELNRAQALLSDEKEKYSDLFNFAPVGFLVLDQQNRVTECNLTGAGMLHVERNLILGKPFRKFVLPSDRDRYDSFVLQTQQGQRGLSAEVRMRRPEMPAMHARLESEPEWGSRHGLRLAMVDIGDRVEAEQSLLAAKKDLERTVAERTAELRKTVDQLFTEITQREGRERELKSAYGELNQRAGQLQQLTSQLVQTEQRERKRIAQILHDTLQQQLAAIRLLVGGLAERSPDERWKDELLRAEEQIGDAIRTTRTLTTELNPPALAQDGLIGGLEWLAKWMEQKHGLRVELSFDNRRIDMSEDTKMLLFDSIRELLFNVVKHAEAPFARVGLEAFNGAGLRITVSDQGRGFDPQALRAAGPEGGFGLFSIRERLQTFGGRLQVDSAVGRGTRFALYVPQVLSVERGDRRIRLLLVDDHSAIREGLARLLGKERDIEVIGQASDGEGAVELAQKLKPDIVLMDIEMPGIDGIEATRRIRPRSPATKILGFSMHTDGELPKAMVEAGAVDCLTKSSSLDELVKAIRGTMMQAAAV